MDVYILKKSKVDPLFWEVLLNGSVIQEIRITFPLKRVPSFFKTIDEIEPWVKSQEYTYAKWYAYFLLNQRSYSKKGLKQKLEKKGISSTQCSRVVDEIDLLGYLPDADLAASIIRSKLRQGYGPHYIKRVLQEKGLEPQAIDDASTKAAMQKLDAKLKGKEKPKAIAFLLRRGFPLDLISTYFEEVLHEKKFLD